MAKKYEFIGTFGVCTFQGNWDEARVFQSESPRVGERARFWAEVLEGTLYEVTPRFLDGAWVFDHLPPEEQEIRSL